MIVGVPLWAVIYAMVKRVVGRMLKKKGLPEETRKYLNVDKIKGKEFVMLDKESKKENKRKKKIDMEDEIIEEQKEEAILQITEAEAEGTENESVDGESEE